MLPFCPNDFDDNNITKIAARAEESRQLARVHTLRAQDKIVDFTIPNTKWYLTLPEISYGFILQSLNAMSIRSSLLAFLWRDSRVGIGIGSWLALHHEFELSTTKRPAVCRAAMHVKSVEI
ncbi:hypothetical protein TNCV_2102671 [Trichonephila clavipes]|nr:hypothetical protein TNCV_2102671 [Trichonephila clavipes]